MEADWDELCRVAVPAPSPHTSPTIATTFAFDDVQELLWVGNEFVSIPSLLIYFFPQQGWGMGRWCMESGSAD